MWEKESPRNRPKADDFYFVFNTQWGVMYPLQEAGPVKRLPSSCEVRLVETHGIRPRRLSAAA